MYMVRRNVVLAVITVIATITHAADRQADDKEGVRKNIAVLNPVRMRGVSIEGFWGEQIKRQVERWIPHCIAQMEEGGSGGELLNLVEAGKALRGEPHGQFKGLAWTDAYVYNIVESICMALEIDPGNDTELARAQKFLRQKMEQWIFIILAAQEEDGYIHSYHTLGGQPRFMVARDHEFYVKGYFLDMAVAHYRMTGGEDSRLYDAAIRLADLLDDTFGPEPKRTWKNGHPGLEYSLCRLAELVDEIEGTGAGDRYVALSRHFLDNQHTTERSTYDQSDMPAVKMSEARGHAVRATYFYTAMADIARLHGDEGYRQAVARLWDNTINRKFYLTGGVGATRQHEAFGRDFELPNNTAYCESCAGSGMVFWAKRMHRLHADAHYMDVQERILINKMAGAVDIEGGRYFYRNPLASGWLRHTWHVCPCCIGNIPRTLFAIKDMMYALNQDRDVLYVNHYVASAGVIDNVGGHALGISQQTRYPWDGRIDLILEPEDPAMFTLALRIPDRAESDLYSAVPDLSGQYALTVNGEDYEGSVEQGYARISRTWRAGDRVVLTLPMDVQRVYCDERVHANRGRVAIQRGPVVYNFEEVDHDGPLRELTIPRAVELRPLWRDGFLGGVVVVQGPGLLGVPNNVRLNRHGYSQVWMRETIDE